MAGPATGAVVIPPGDGISVENPAGGILTFKVLGEQSRESLTAADTAAAPGEGPPLHVHREQDELILLLDGAMRIRLGDSVVDAGPGSCVFIPRGTPHTWQNVGATPVRFFITITPASSGFEQFFLRYAQLPEAERGHEAFARLGAETQALEVIGPPLAQSHPR